MTYIEALTLCTLIISAIGVVMFGVCMKLDERRGRMTREELEMRTLVRESDVIDKTDGSELAKAFNHLWEKYVEQEPCEDAISRQAAHEAVYSANGLAGAMKNIDALPSVTPQPEIGHWIEVAKYPDGKHEIKCSECECHIFDRGHANSYVVKEKYKYCPRCGAKMVEPQKREEK